MFSLSCNTTVSSHSHTQHQGFFLFCENLFVTSTLTESHFGFIECSAEFNTFLDHGSHGTQGRSVCFMNKIKTINSKFKRFMNMRVKSTRTYSLKVFFFLKNGMNVKVPKW